MSAEIPWSPRVSFDTRNREAAMAKLVTTIVLGLLLVFEATAAQSGDATFKLTNKARFSVMVKIFARNRNCQWPSNTTHWDLKDGAEHALRVACQNGEQV